MKSKVCSEEQTGKSMLHIWLVLVNNLKPYESLSIRDHKVWRKAMLCLECAREDKSSAR
jgi:hypothetical protein